MRNALIFDCDGVLADTEKHGHLPAFNRTFKEVGLQVQWSSEEYAERIKIGGGKERMQDMLTSDFVAEHNLSTDVEEQRAMVARWHAVKTRHYTELISAGTIPARPGVRRLAEEALKAGWSLAVASTSAEVSVRAVLETVVGLDMADHFEVFAGDVVPQKKPWPDIYLLALDRLGVQASDAVVVEDSGIGLRAARAADLRTIVTISSYTAHDDMEGAALVLSDLGEPDSPAQDRAGQLEDRGGEASPGG